MMVKVGVFARYSAIAAPERIECVPSSSGLKPRVDSPMHRAAARRAVRTAVEVISFQVLFAVLKRQIFLLVGSSVPA